MLNAVMASRLSVPLEPVQQARVIRIHNGNDAEMRLGVSQTGSMLSCHEGEEKESPSGKAPQTAQEKSVHAIEGIKRAFETDTSLEEVKKPFEESGLATGSFFFAACQKKSNTMAATPIATAERSPASCS